MTDRIVILAGGISSRMKEGGSPANINPELVKDADEKPKAMLRVGENLRPFLDYLLMNILKAGLKEVIIVRGEKDSSIVDYYSNINKDTELFKNLKFYFAVQPIPEGRKKPLGTSDALIHAMETVPSWKEGSFLSCNSDNLYSAAAFKTLMNSSYPNAMIDYDRDGLKFDLDRIRRFAITRKNTQGFLTDIVEKPSEDYVETVKRNDGYVGVSMNIWKFDWKMLYPAILETPLHHERNEREIPVSVKILIHRNPGSVFAYRMKEHVPDLTSREDITGVIEYLNNSGS